MSRETRAGLNISEEPAIKSVSVASTSSNDAAAQSSSAFSPKYTMSGPSMPPQRA
jgi:hypothetical protein